MDQENPGKRVLSDADVKALADEMERRIVNRFYRNLGRGVWALVWKAALVALVALAAYGAANHGAPPR